MTIRRPRTVALELRRQTNPKVINCISVGPEVTRLSDILRQQSDVLLTQMTIKEAIAKFEGTESDALVVVDSLEDMHVIGMLTEQFALRRYSEHLDRHRRSLSGESA